MQIHIEMRNNVGDRLTLNVKKKSIKINALLNIVKQCCNILFPLITYPYVSRVLGSENLGKYSFSDSIISYFLIIAALGIPTYAIREGARIRDEKKAIERFSSEMFTINFIALMLSYLLLIICLLLVPRLNRDVILTYILSINMITNVLGRDWINSIYEDYVYISIRYITFHLISVILVFCFVHKPSDYIIYTIIMMIGNSGGYIFNFFYTQKYVPLKLTKHINIRKHIKPILYLLCTTAAVTIYVKSDITILGFFRSDTEVGIYTLSSKIYTIIKAMLNATIAVTIPRLSNYWGTNNVDGYNALLNKLRRALYIIILPSTVGLFFMADEVIVLLGGNEYKSGNVALMILSIALIASVFAGFYAQGILVAKREEKYYFIATITSAVVNIILNLMFIPHFGMNSAALSTLIAEIIVISICKYKSKEMVEIRYDKDVISIIVGCIFIVLICLSIKYIAEGIFIRLLFAVIISIVIYVLTLILMRNQTALEILVFAKKIVKNKQ